MATRLGDVQSTTAERYCLVIAAAEPGQPAQARDVRRGPVRVTAAPVDLDSADSRAAVGLIPLTRCHRHERRLVGDVLQPKQVALAPEKRVEPSSTAASAPV